MSRFPLFEKLAFLAFACAFLVLMVTGVIYTWILRTPMEGYMLMLHVGAGGVFAVSLAVLVVLCAEQCGFGATDISSSSPKAREKVSFWLMAIAGLGLILSAALAMFPLFGTEGQHWLLSVHEISVYLALLAGLLYAALVLPGHQDA